MADLGYPTCPACGDRPGRQKVFCASCWAFVPPRLRHAIDVAWRAVKAHPASKRTRADYDTAISEAVAAADAAAGRPGRSP